MNPKRLLLALLAAFITLSATDCLIHEIWLKSLYALDAGKLWRTEADIKTHTGGIVLGEFLVALAFTLLWARISLEGAGFACAIAFGVMMNFAYSGSVIMQGAVQPLPEGLVIRWIVSGLLQSLALAIVLFLVYRPTKGCPDL